MRAALFAAACLLSISQSAQPQTNESITTADSHAAAQLAEGNRLAGLRTPESFRAALTVYEQALAEWRKAGNSPKQVETLVALATVNFFLHQTDRAGELLAQAVALAHNAGDSGSEANALFASGNFHHATGNAKQALEELSQSAALYRSLGVAAGEAIVTNLRATIFGQLKDSARAIQLYEEAVPLFQQAKNQPGEALALLSLAQLYNNLETEDGFAKSVNYFQRAVPLFQATHDTLNEAYAWWGLGNVTNKRGRFEDSREDFDRALAIFQARKDMGREKQVSESLGLAWMRIGMAREKLGQLAAAVEAYERAIPVYAVVGEQSMQGTAYSKISQIQSALGKRDQALLSETKALDHFKAAGDRGGQASALIGMAGIFMTAGDHRKSLDLALQSLALLEGDTVPIRRLAALQVIGDSYSALRNSLKASEYLNQVLALSGNNVHAKAGALASLANVSSGMGDQKSALQFAQQALQLHQSTNNATAENKVRGDLALIYSALGNKTEAVKLMQESLAQARKDGSLQQQSATLNNLAQIYQSFGDFAEAEKLYGESLVLVRQVGDVSQEAGTLSDLGILFHLLGREDKALEALQRAVLMQRDLKNRKEEAIELSNLALFYSETGELQKALDTYAEVSSIYTDRTNLPERGVLLNNIGVVYRELGAGDRARSYFTEALQIREQTDDDDGRAVTLNNLAVLAQYEGDDDARGYYDRSLQIATRLKNRSWQASLHSGLGILSSEKGDSSGAVAQLSASLAIARAIGDPNREALALHNLATEHEKRNRFDEALDCATQALTIWRKLGRVEGESKTLYIIAKVERAKGNLPAALRDAEASIRLSETLRGRLQINELRALWLASAGNAYELKTAVLMQLASERKDPQLAGKALETSERARARSLLDLLEASHAHLRTGVRPDLLAREQSVERALNAKALRQSRLGLSEDDAVQREQFNREIEELKADHERIEAQIFRESPAYAALTQPQPLTVSQIQQQLDPDTLLLEYSLGKERSYLWAVTSKSLVSYELPKREQIEQAATDFHQALTETANPKSASDAGAALSAILLAPAASQLTKKRLVIVSDGILQSYVPFAALPSPQARSGGTALPLIADYEIVTEPSASTIAVLRSALAGRKHPARSVAVIADAVFSRDDERLKNADRSAGGSSSAPTFGSSMPAEGFDRLKLSGTEARNILAAAKRDGSLSRLGFEATKTAAQDPALANYRIVHFATHGVLDPVHPELSGIVFSLYSPKGESLDGYLRLNEIFNLKLPVDLVVLSACQSGLGRQVSGEGIMGITRGFLYAGSASLVASLWKVDDEATSELMTRFYNAMLGSKRQHPAAALRSAQLSMAAEPKWNHPAFWAAFVLEGEWK